MRLFGGQYSFVKGEPRDLFCITATDGRGTMLWQYGDPYRDQLPYIAHTGDHGLAFADVDGDCRQEIVAIEGDRKLLVIDAAADSVNALTLLPHDNFAIVKVAQTGNNGRTTIVAQVS